LRRLGAIGIVYALILPVFGVTQQMLLVGDWHWLIQTAHLLVSFGATPFLGMISVACLRRKQATRDLAGQPQPVR